MEYFFRVTPNGLSSVSFVDMTSTLFAVFEVSCNEYYYEDLICNMKEKFTLIPHCTKLLVTSREWKQIGDIPETLHVMHERRGPWDKDSLDPMLQILSKRWQTLDLISIMHGLQTSAENCFHSGFAYQNHYCC